MNNELNPANVARLLTASTRQLDEHTLSALADARRQSLQKQAIRSPVFSLSASNWTLQWMPRTAQPWVAAGLLLVALTVGMGYWQHMVKEQQIDDTDVAILTDELPIEVFLD